jgi:hypothetical protein
VLGRHRDRLLCRRRDGGLDVVVPVHAAHHVL